MAMTMTALLRSSASRPLRYVAIPRGQRPIASLIADDGRGMRRCPSHRRGEGVFQRRATAVAPVSSIPAEPDDRPRWRRGRSFSSPPPSHPPPSSPSSENGPVEPRRDALASADGVVGRPIDFDVASSIEGKESQVRTTMPATGRRCFREMR